MTLIRKGNKGANVKLIQEWLNLHDIELAVDGDFGPATEYGVREFQIRNTLTLAVDGIVGNRTFEKLIEPMTKAIDYIDCIGCLSISKRVTKYAKQHLNQNPREVGGQNMGPWVRLYMDGYEGNNWPWCAGFVCYILQQAYNDDPVVLMPFEKSFSVDNIVRSAVRNKVFYKENEVKKDEIVPGSFYVLRKEWGDWTHIGIVLEVKNDIMITVEGNTNEQGSREGIKVAKKIRGFKNKDFIIY